MKHKHYDVLVQWLADQTLEIEYRADSNDFWNAPIDEINPLSRPMYEWRIKPKMVRVGRHEWSMPLDVAPDRNTKYFSVVSGYVSPAFWDGGKTDRDRLNRGIVHLTEEAAQQHADALACINRGDL